MLIHKKYTTLGHYQNGETDKMSKKNTLWLLFLEGDDNAFSALFRNHYELLHNYGIKLSTDSNLTEDCLQNLFIYIYENRRSLNHVVNLNGYLFTSLRRSIIREVQKKQKKIGFDELDQNDKSFNFSHEDFIIQKETKETGEFFLNQMINALSVREREIIYLKYYSELSNSEISAIMEITKQSTSNTLQKAMSKLRDRSVNTILQKILSS